MLFDDTDYREETPPSNSWNIFGVDEAVETLRAHIAKGLINRSYMFIGPEGIGKSLLAVRFAQTVISPRDGNPTSPNLESATAKAIEQGTFGDVQILGASESSKTDQVSTQDLRAAISRVSLTAFNSKNHFIIFAADSLTGNGMNAMLKLLEEPPGDTTLVILTDSPNKFPATIPSRCYDIVLRPLPKATLASILVEQDVVDGTDEALKYAILAGGRYGKAISMISDSSFLMALEVIMEDIEKYSFAAIPDRLDYSNSLSKAWRNDRKTVLETLGYWEQWWHDALLLVTGSTEDNILRVPEIGESNLNTEIAVEALTAIKSAQENLLDNVNPRLAIDQMMIVIPQLEINR